MKADILRDKYLEFFRLKEHKVADSDSLVPKDDPTVLFTPAGMNQFKKQFLGLITDFTRATSSQRCLRTDDLDKVGKTDCHHTFFEMLGNFSFGDYFKKEAIEWAWEFLTQELKIPAQKLWVSVYQDDDQAYDIWKDVVKFPTEKIVRLGDHDNFWPADAKQNGPNGPCGPCSEIFFDLGESVGCGKKGCNPSCSCGRFIEIWNLVFTQFNRKEGGILEPLPQKNIDTGMGLERITAVMQGMRSNFETDLFEPIIKEIKRHAKNSGSGYTPEIYALADHLRAIVFSIYDGILPSNEARGYVVRKLIRKSVLHNRSLGINKEFLYTLVAVLAEVMKKPYPQLNQRRENIAQIILAEEKNFIATLDSSGSLLQEKFSAFKAKPDALKIGEQAFLLYDTYGIPLDLTKAWLAENKLPFSQEAFENAMNQQKTRSKAQSSMKGDVFSIKELQLKDVADTKFIGYDELSSEAKILTIIKDGSAVDEISLGQEAKIVVDRTPFYAEQGGQVGDKGLIATCSGVFEVVDTQKAEHVFLHIGKVKEGKIKKLDTAKIKVDIERRLAIARNHTATHLLQAALRQVLGDHVQQQGSFVGEDRLRFDFTHFKDVSDAELARIEEIVNNGVMDNHKVIKKEMSLQEAKKEGALAFFAEKYEERVRVVAVEGISKEFCGGTHLDQTGAIGLFKILHESSIASGVRRIEAVSGKKAYIQVKEHEDIINSIAQSLKSPVDSLPAELDKKLKQVKDLEKQVSALKLNCVSASIDDMIKSAKDKNGVKIIAAKLESADIDLLRKTADLIKQKQPKTIIMLGSVLENKAYLVAASNISGLDMGGLIKEIAPMISGSGGGRKDFAQAGGTQPQNLDKALDKFNELAGQLV